jgi:hypothetical protein
VAGAAQANGKYAMSAGLFAPMNDLVAEGHNIFSIGADVVAISAYCKQRLDFARGQIDGLPADLKPKTQSPYA